MAKEIERKFLVDLAKLDLSKLTNWTTNIEQGYLSKEIDTTIRVRIEDKKGFITIKGPTENISRDEFEYEIPFDDAESLLEMCPKTLAKKRTTIRFEHKYWTVDVFEGDNAGLIVAEVELKSEDEKIVLPPWITEEVSGDKRYYNVNLINNPFKNW